MLNVNVNLNINWLKLKIIPPLLNHTPSTVTRVKPRIQSCPAVQVEVSTDHPEEGGGKGDEQLQQHEEH